MTDSQDIAVEEFRRKIRQDAAMWYMKTRAGWSNQEIADIFKIPKIAVFLRIKQYAAERQTEMREYMDIDELDKMDLTSV